MPLIPLLGRTMPPRRGRRRAAAAAALAAALAAAGCGSDTNAPVGTATQVVVFASDRGQLAGQLDIVMYDLAQQGFYALPNLNSVTAPDSTPTVTLDARFIAFVSVRAAGAGGSDVWVYDRAQALVLSPPGVNSGVHETDPAFSGDGLKLAFVRDTLGRKRLRLIDGLADVLIALPGLDSLTAAWSDWDPSPSQTAQRIAFVSDRHGNADVLVYDAAGDSIMDLPYLASAGEDLDPVITPGGRYVCFASNRAGGAGGFDLHLFDLDTKQAVTLAASANSAADERRPAISVGGRVITFQSNRAGGAGGWDLWNHNRDTGATGQGLLQSSLMDDVQPALVYP